MPLDVETIFLVQVGAYSKIELSFNLAANGCSVYLILSNSIGSLPFNIPNILLVGNLKTSSLFNKFLFTVEIFFCPYSVKSPSSEFDFFTDIVSAVEIPVRSEKNWAVRISVTPRDKIKSQLPNYFISLLIGITIF